MEFHVSLTGCDRAKGTTSEPFRTVSRAAELALPGDTVKIHAGIYREWVSPVNGGTIDHRIVYEAAGDGEVIITGSEPFSDWKDEGEGVWRAEIPNTLFTIRNPFATLLYGDWLFNEMTGNHLGDVYINGKSLYERQSMEDVRHPSFWKNAKYPEDSLYTWFVEVNNTMTVIWANFGDHDPRKELTEISVRPYCFWPEKTGRNYITVRGLTLKQAATQWAPPTALQEGLIGPHWSKGWIIENNKISDSKCTGISLGKDISTGDNEWSNQKYKMGTQREQEVIFRAIHNHWDKEHIGSHIVRNNEIFECEQAGIVGHLGAVFSEIYGNHIYNVHHKRLFHGAEVGGIKLHASLDTQIHDNIIHSCYRAVWFDWQAQGTHLYRNVCFDSLSEDLFIEVCHGPYMVDHNLFLSKMNFRNVAQGGAFVHNLFAGRFVMNPDRGRQTPYHFPHETAVAGYANIIGGDERFYNNIFIRDEDDNNEPVAMGFFEHLPLRERTAEEIEADKKAKMDGLPSKNDATLYPVGLGCYNEYSGPDDKFWEKPFGPHIFKATFPCSIGGNLYLKNAVPCTWEQNAVVRTEKDCYVSSSIKRDGEADSKGNIGISISSDAKTGEVQIKLNPAIFNGTTAQVITTELLGKSYHAEMAYEEPDGSAYRFDRDYFGTLRPETNVAPGPFEAAGTDIQEFTLTV